MRDKEEIKSIVELLVVKPQTCDQKVHNYEFKT